MEAKVAELQARGWPSGGPRHESRTRLMCQAFGGIKPHYAVQYLRIQSTANQTSVQTHLCLPCARDVL